MMKRALIGLAAAAVFTGCCTKCETGCRAGAKAPLAKHVVMIGIDGFGAQYIPWEKMPNLSKLRDDGLYTVGRCGYPTASAINWACAFFGTTVEMHGYRNWNSKKPDVPAYAVTDRGMPLCIFRAIRDQDPEAYTASLYTWDGIGHCQDTNAASFVQHFPGPGRDEYSPRDEGVVDEGLKQLAHKPKLILFYQGQVDSLGHGYGWGSEKFTNACVRVDENIGRIVAGVKEAGMLDDTVFLVVADHGGEGKKHGMACMPCFEIPFLVSGPAVKGMRLREPVMLADAAPTIADILGYRVPEEWRGRPAVVAR